ncbi:MAG TPA: prepilin peptidase [Bacillota bacterium]|nr:hypothetical protein [Fastidiosipila sp.]HPX93929.1 prepilin peptidase [Bacillota bacterium]HQB81827.1 prepilin peptidase [Bacillota bacterium]
MDRTFSCLCNLVAFLVAAAMSWRDIRTRLVADHELAWFAFFAVLPRLLAPPPLYSVPLPLWLWQSVELIRTSGGGGLLLILKLPARLVTGRNLLGMGDVLFTLAAGFMLPAGASVHMVCLAFLLALPFSLAKILGRKKKDPLPFIPFLTASAFIIRLLPTSARFF